MAIKTRCLTPGANFTTKISKDKVSVEVSFGKKIEMTEKEAELIEALLHNQIEVVLSRFYLSQE